MGLFAEWLEKKNESDVHNPMSQQTLGGNPVMSGLEKITRGLRQGNINGGFTGFGVIANTFGLSQPEVQALMQQKVITNGANGMTGWGVDENKLQALQRQLNPGQSSMTTPPKRPALPPPPPVPTPRPKIV